MPALPRLEPRTTGGVLCAAGLALLWPSSLLTTALGIELLAAAFWSWARAANDASAQVPRWAWMRQPATAMWLAAAIHEAMPILSHGVRPPWSGALEVLRWGEAIGVVWAGLELMAALPLARPYSDLPGPLLSIRPWLPVMLPAAGFVVLWRHAPNWIGVVQVRDAAVPLLLLTALLGALRAFARRQWTASLRWLAVSDSALAGVLVARGAMPAEATFLLWLGACGGHAFLLAGEMRGSAPRRGAVNARLWRTAGWISIAALSWPALLVAGFGAGGGFNVVYFLGASIPIALSAWITVGRMAEAPERRRMVRPDAGVALGRLTAVGVMTVGPLALLLAWWTGFEPSFRATAAALAPAVLGGAAALAARQGAGQPMWAYLQRAGEAAPVVAGEAYRAVVGLERWLMGVLGRLIRALTSPLHDLHTGDAQEYLLFLVGLGVLALVLPLLQ